MKPRHLLAPLIVLVALCIVTQAFAQKQELGLNIGYGRTAIDYSHIKVVLPLDADLGPFYEIGCSYTYTTIQGFLSLNTGLNLDRRSNRSPSNWHTTYLTVPIGINLNFGNKVRFLVGGGLDASILLRENTFLSSYRDLILGAFLKAGAGYQITDKYRIMLSYQTNLDVTLMNVENMSSPGGIPYQLENKGYDGFLSLSVYRSIGK